MCQNLERLKEEAYVDLVEIITTIKNKSQLEAMSERYSLQLIKKMIEIYGVRCQKIAIEELTQTLIRLNS